MNILLVTDQYTENNATTNCLRELVKVLSADNNITVTTTSEKKILTENIKLVKLEYGEKRFFKRLIKYLKNNNYKLSSFVNIFVFIFKYIYYYFNRIIRKLFGADINFKVFFDINCLNTIDSFKKVMSDGDYECIISVTNPFYCHYISYMWKVKNPNTKWIAYYLDPFSSNVYNARNKKACIAFEHKILKYCDKIILTEEIKHDFENSRLIDYVEKSIVCEFPNIRNFRNYSKNSTIEFSNKTINCLFIGYLYSKIRNPQFFLDLLCNCKDKNIKFYIVGRYIDNSSDNSIIENYKSKLGDTLRIIDTVNLEEALKIMNDADILVNIGNSVSNQMPSKIFDYISTGKPIVNIVKLSNCPTLKYTERYPHALTIFESEEINDDLVDKFVNFCVDSVGKRASYESIENLYKTATPLYVANKIREVLK